MTDLSIDQVPPRIDLCLNGLQRCLVSYLADRLPHKTLNEILQGAFARGLAIVVGEERKKEGRVVQGHRQPASGLNAWGDKIPFAKPKYRKPSPIPEAISIDLDDDLRDRVERLLLSDRGSTLDSVIETALRLGMREQEKPGALDPVKVFDEVKVKEAKEAARERRRRMLARLQALAAG